MDWQMITQMISTLGFPIVVTIVLIIYIGNGMKELKSSLDKNTLMLTRLVERLGAQQGLPIGGAPDEEY